MTMTGNRNSPPLARDTDSELAKPGKISVPSKLHIPALDGVRGIAIAAVLLAHTLPIIQVQGRLGSVFTAIADGGAFGVDLFFVVSGFLITGILLDSRNTPGYYKNFYGRRMLRLFPVYYGYIFLVMALVPWIHHVTHTNMPDYSGNWWWYLTYFCNWKSNFAASDPYLGHFWSLAVEEQFYLVWPTVIFFVPQRNLAWFCGELIVSAPLLRFVWSHENVYWNQLYRFTVSRWDAIAFGVIAALVLRSDRWRPIAKRWAPVLAIVGIGGLLAAALLHGTISWANSAIQTYGASLAAIGFTGFVFFAATSSAGPLIRWLQTPFLLALGKYSYAIYVFHLLIHTHIAWVGAFVVRKMQLPGLPSQIAIFALSNAAIFYAGSLSWKYFESRILKLKSRFV